MCSRLLLAVDNKRGPRTQIILSTSHYRLVANTKVGPSATPPATPHARSLFRHRTPNRERPRYPLRAAATHRGMRRTHPSLLHSHHCPRESETRLPYMTVQCRKLPITITVHPRHDPTRHEAGHCLQSARRLLQRNAVGAVGRLPYLLLPPPGAILLLLADAL